MMTQDTSIDQAEWARRLGELDVLIAQRYMAMGEIPTEQVGHVPERLFGPHCPLCSQGIRLGRTSKVRRHIGGRGYGTDHRRSHVLRRVAGFHPRCTGSSARERRRVAVGRPPSRRPPYGLSPNIARQKTCCTAKANSWRLSNSAANDCLQASCRCSSSR